MWIDSHAHLTTPSLESQLEEMLARAKEAGVDKIINVCTTPEEAAKSFCLQAQFPFIYTAGSTTPHEAQKRGQADFDFFAARARAKQLIAVGETGLDYYYYKDTQEEQKQQLRSYLALAHETSLPVIIHCRDAFDDLITIIDQEYSKLPGVLHCFTGTLEEAKQLLERGWYISFSGIITFKKSEALRSTVRSIPFDRLLIETDTPYLAPQSKRGKINEPSFLTETAACVADIKGVSLEYLAHITSDNARFLFDLK